MTDPRCTVPECSTLGLAPCESCATPVMPTLFPARGGGPVFDEVAEHSLSAAGCVVRWREHSPARCREARQVQP